jgi:hypothetical protein
MSDQAKLMVLVFLLTLLAFVFGMDVGSFGERQAESRRKVARYLQEHYIEVQPGAFAPRPDKPESANSPEGGASED